MVWHDTITRILTATRLLGGDDSAPLNIPLKQIEDNLNHLKLRFAFRTFRVNTDLSLTDFDATNGRVGDWDALTNTNSRQPIPAGSLLFAHLSASCTATAVTNPLAMQITVDLATSGEVVMNAVGYRWSATPANSVRLNDSGFSMVRNADALKVSKTNIDVISAASVLYLLRIDGLTGYDPP